MGNYFIPNTPFMSIQESSQNAYMMRSHLANIIGGARKFETADNILIKFPTIQKIASTTINELCSVTGITKQKAIRIHTAILLGRISLQSEDPLPSIGGPDSVANILMPILSYRDQEYMVILVLNTRNKVIKTVELYKGSTNSSMVRVSEIFRDAIRMNAPSIILSHNHPSGDPSPSVEDVALTRATIEAGKLLDINVIDHIVIGNGKWTSMKEKGLAFL